ncbi:MULTISPECIES: hypothetical protein [unclassified Corallococcus]|uniref:hypothetical protein n=1 Tax=unclassified Corallococcus TaxID=2685029 RepID=UPI001A8D8557|nr:MULTISPECIES: hypothetical protein [unclassified Corallococcus]MBN9682395.1 hypothetical protein [Corallococcus sp. NCSPR001]WAS86051.1 hypothetical protein O0N60_03540 [Corallococcus sp. NCRR]
MAASDERRFQSLVLAPIRRVQRRLNVVAWSGAGIAPLWALATACVVSRLLLRDLSVWAVPPLVIAGLAWWFVRARSRGVSLEYAAVLADRSANAGGLLLTRLERPVGEWELSLNQFAQHVKPPEVPWRRPVGALLGALVFLAVGFLVPLPTLRTSNINAAAATQVAAVQAQAEALAREEPLGPDVEEELRRLSEEVAQGRFDSADWEASDALEQRLAERASEAAAELNRASEAAAELEDALAAAGGAEAATRERESLEQALMALDARASGTSEDDATGAQEAPASERNSQGQGAGDQDGDKQGTGEQGGEKQGSGDPSAREAEARASARAQASGSPDQIADLRRTLERRQQSLAERFGEENASRGNRGAQARRPTRRQQSGQGQKGQGQKGQGQGQDGQGEGEEGDGEGAQGRQHASRNTRQGKGEGAGVSRGGESQPVVFGGEAEMDPDRLAFQPLPDGNGGEAEELWGLRAADPQARTGQAGPSSAKGTGAKGDATAGPTSGPLLPRNRDLVKRYFGGP